MLTAVLAAGICRVHPRILLQVGNTCACIVVLYHEEVRTVLVPEAEVFGDDVPQFLWGEPCVVWGRGTFHRSCAAAPRVGVILAAICDTWPGVPHIEVLGGVGGGPGSGAGSRWEALRACSLAPRVPPPAAGLAAYTDTQLLNYSAMNQAIADPMPVTLIEQRPVLGRRAHLQPLLGDQRPGAGAHRRNFDRFLKTANAPKNSQTVLCWRAQRAQRPVPVHQLQYHGLANPPSNLISGGSKDGELIFGCGFVNLSNVRAIPEKELQETFDGVEPQLFDRIDGGKEHRLCGPGRAGQRKAGREHVQDQEIEREAAYGS
eukprot:s585_g4.t1